MGPKSTADGRRLPWKSWVRTTHTYLSLFGMLSMLFFGITGFVMNHEHWFLDDEQEAVVIGQLPPELLATPSQPVIVELLRTRYGVSGFVSKFEVDGNELTIKFRKPGQSFDAVIYRDDGYLLIESETGGVLDALAQVHQGDHTGIVGGLLIDAVAFLLVFAGATGLTIWATLPRRRAVGVTALAVSLLLMLAFYWYVAG